jgi:thymidylate synthase (FAD)
MSAINRAAFGVYKQLLLDGVPRELARSVLPVATYSEMFATVDLHNLLKFISERTADGAQYEIKVYAEAMLELIKPFVPAAIAAWETHNAGR